VAVVLAAPVLREMAARTHEKAIRYAAGDPHPAEYHEILTGGDPEPAVAAADEERLECYLR
jgi:hypothetical protein